MKKIFIFIIISFIVFSQENYFKGKIISQGENVKAEEYEEEINYYYSFLIEVEENKQTKKVKINHPIYKDVIYNSPLKKGDKVIVYKDDESNVYYISDKIKIKEIFILLGIFVGIFVFLAKLKGIKSLFSLVATVLVFIFIIIPLIIQGFSPILSALILGISSTVFTLFSLEGFSKKIIAALSGTLGGILFSALLSIIFVKLTGLSGLIDSEVMNYIDAYENIDLKELISAAIIIGSLGAIMDNAVSISSALFEVVSHSENLSRRKIFESGINIGKDVMGTMVNTLILAYLGSSLFTIILFYKQQSEFPLLRIINSEFIIVEILRALCGSIGILVTVPITAIVSAYLFGKKRPRE